MWERELNFIDHPQKDEILYNVTHGFDLVNTNIEPTPVETPNHPSAQPSSPLYEKIHAQICEEIACGNYIVTPVKPVIVSPLAGILKDDGSVRLIHDCSLPEGAALNDYACINEKVSFETVEQAAQAIKHNSYFCKIDLKSAYRSVKISKESQKLTGLKFKVNNQETYVFDSKLPFGARLAPSNFNLLSQCVKQMMIKRGFSGVYCYIDDFLIVSDSFNECQTAMNVLLSLLRELGFMINWKKVCDPSRCVTFLGIEMDSVDMCLRLPQNKLLLLREELGKFMKLRRASKRILQRLAGRLSWAARVVFGGRGFLRATFNAISSLRHKSDRIRLSGPLLRDIRWWYNLMHVFNGCSLLLNKQPIIGFQTDACLEGAGMVHNDDFAYCNWSLDWPEVNHLSINYKETLSIVLGAARWAPLWVGKRIFVQSDNMAAVGIINKGSCKNSLVQECLNFLFWLSAMWSFKLSAVHVPGIHNGISDTVSRLHEPGHRAFFSPYLNVFNKFRHHVSQAVMNDIICRSYGEKQPVANSG